MIPDFMSPGKCYKDEEELTDDQIEQALIEKQQWDDAQHEIMMDSYHM